MDNNTDKEVSNDIKNSPTRRASKRQKLAALRRTSAGSTSTQPTTDIDPSLSFSTNNSTTNSPDINVTPTVSSNTSVLPTLPSNNSTVATFATLSAPTAAPSAQALPTISSPSVVLTSSDDSLSQPVISTLQKRFVHPGEKIPRLTKNPTRAQVMNITTLLLTLDCPYTFVDVVPHDVILHLETLLQTRFYMDRIARKACLQWRTC